MTAAPQRMYMASLIFNWKLVGAESRILKQSSEQRERQFSEPLEFLSEARCSRMRVAKCLLVSPINSQIKHLNLMRFI